jgi:hypothetical protein
MALLRCGMATKSTNARAVARYRWHACAQVALTRLNDDVAMVIHQAAGMAGLVVVLAGLGKKIKPLLAVCIAEIDVFATILSVCPATTGSTLPSVQAKKRMPNDRCLVLQLRGRLAYALSPSKYMNQAHSDLHTPYRPRGTTIRP